MDHLNHSTPNNLNSQMPPSAEVATKIKNICVCGQYMEMTHDAPIHFECHGCGTNWVADHLIEEKYKAIIYEEKEKAHKQGFEEGKKMAAKLVEDAKFPVRCWPEEILKMKRPG